MPNQLQNNSNFPDSEASVVAPQPLAATNRFKLWHLSAAILVFVGAGVGVRQFSRASSQPQLLSVVEGEQVVFESTGSGTQSHSVIDAKASAQHASLILQPAGDTMVTTTDTATPTLGDKSLTKLIVVARSNSCAGTQVNLQIGLQKASGNVISTPQHLTTQYVPVAFLLPQSIVSADNPHLKLIASFDEKAPSNCRSSVLIDKVSYYGSK